MTKLDEDTKNYLQRFHEKSFSEYDFIGLLLPLLKKHGVQTINERELVTKLYYYKCNGEYQELFQDICKAKIGEEVDIHNAMYREKYFNHSILWDSANPKKLYLTYDENEDLSCYTSKLSSEGLEKMNQLVRRMAMRNLLERKSSNNLNIYDVNPNRNYTLIRGNYGKSSLSWNLVTNGQVEKESSLDETVFANCFWESPIHKDENVQLENIIAKYVKIKNASYVAMLGMSDDEIKRYNLFTTINNFKKLQEIDEMLSSEQVIKRLVLK